MITIDKYIANPCGTLSLPYWKHKKLIIPDNMKVIHQNDFHKTLSDGYTNESYFRLYHSLEKVADTALPEVYIKTARPCDIGMITEIINRSYDDLSVTVEQIAGYTETEVFDSDLWVIVFDKEKEIPVGCGLADFDAEIKEGILEWIQVIPEWRGRKIGQLIVNTLLTRLRKKARFVTVSGRCDNLTCPEMLYRKCGFVGNDVWHILRAK